METSVLFYLYYSLFVIDDISITNHGICYDLNILEPNSQISYELSVKTEISITTLDLWKIIHKKTLTRDEARIEKDFNNGSTYDYSFNIKTSLIGRLEPTLITKLTFRSIVSHFLNVLLFNSNSKTIYNHIYLSLLLNQLQHLIVKGILDHTIKNKRKIYFESN